jgi:transposase, IS605 orfB family
MYKRKFTVFTQLHEENNADLIEYFDDSRKRQSKITRKTFHAIKNSEKFEKSRYNTYLQNEYGITYRTANSIISDAQGRLNALKELKVFEKKQLEQKIEYLEKKVLPKLVLKRNDYIAQLKANPKSSPVRLRNLRRKIVAKKNKLNQLKQKLENVTYQIESGRLKLCFGTKYLLKHNYKRFVTQRDSQMSFIGSKSEKAQNHMLQLAYNPKNNQFVIKLRKDFNDFKNASKDDKFVYGRVYFRHHKSEIISILRQGYSPLSYKIIKKQNRFYLYCTFEIHVEDDEFLTRSSYGTIGLDFNKGFVTLSETNEYGHLLRTQVLLYRFKSGPKTTTDLQKLVNGVVDIALQTGKDICIENLDFKKKKAKTESRQDRKYNEMLHSLAYRQFSNFVEGIAFRNLVYVRKVNPAWTSWLAKECYCPRMKLNVHVGASFVIARRGQGFKDAA